MSGPGQKAASNAGLRSVRVAPCRKGPSRRIEVGPPPAMGAMFRRSNGPVVSSMPEASLTVNPVAGKIGAEVLGVDLSRPPDEAVARALRQALVDHLVLFFRDQTLTPDQQLAFTRLFGPALRVPYVKHLAEHPDIIAVLKEADE